jgi:hypothetical protein
MNKIDIAYTRLRNQHISETTFENPGDVVRWFGAVQAQDYLGALWAVGFRTKNANEESVEKAITDGTIIRTWPMRRTLHFVTSADIRWILELMGPRVIASSAGILRQFELDDKTLARCKKLFVRALQDGKQLSRQAMYKVLEVGRISTSEQRGLHILAHLSQEGFICFGAREGKQQTFALLDEWVPAAKKLARDEALAELARRYFTSHGPATLQDFVWWSGLTVADAKAGLEMVKSHFVQENIEGKTYWIPSAMLKAKRSPATANLLPVYDEYTVAYKDRSAALDLLYEKQAGNGIFFPPIIINGQIVGTWKRALKKDRIIITQNLFISLNKAESRALAAAVTRYSEFLNAPVELA